MPATELVQTTVEDPAALQRQVQNVRDLADQVATAVRSVHSLVQAESGLSADDAGRGTAQGPIDTVPVTASGGSGTTTGSAWPCGGRWPVRRPP